MRCRIESSVRQAVAIGVDTGGTTTAVGAVTADGCVLVDETAPTHRDGPGTAGETVTQLIERVRAVGPGNKRTTMRGAAALVLHDLEQRASSATGSGAA